MNLKKLIRNVGKKILPYPSGTKYYLRDTINDLKEVGYDRDGRRGYLEGEWYRMVSSTCAGVYIPTMTAVNLMVTPTHFPGSISRLGLMYFDAAALFSGMAILPLISYFFKRVEIESKILRETAKANRQYTLTGAPREIPEYVGLDKVGDGNLISRLAAKEMVDDIKEGWKILTTKDKDEKLKGGNK